MAKQMTGVDYGLAGLTSGSQASSTKNSARWHNIDQLALSLYPWLRDNVVYFEDDFLGVLNGDYWTVSSDTGGTNFAWAAGAGGIVSGTAHTDANDGVGIRFNKASFSGDKNAGMEIVWSVELVSTTSRLDMGFTDAITDCKDNIINDIDTPTTTNGAGDCAIFAIDTSQTLITAALVGTDSGGATTKTVLSPTFSPTAGVTNRYKTRIQLYGNNAWCGVWNSSGALLGSAYLSDAIEGGTAIFPFFTYTTVSGAAREAQIDVVRIWQDRG